MLVFALLLLLSYISLAVNPAKAWYMTALGLLYVPLVIINFLLLLGGLRRMSRSFLIPLVALLPSLVFSQMMLQLTERLLCLCQLRCRRFVGLRQLLQRRVLALRKLGLQTFLLLPKRP